MFAPGSSFQRPGAPVCAVCLVSNGIVGDCDVLHLVQSGDTVRAKVSRWEHERRPRQVTSRDLGIFRDGFGGHPVCRPCFHQICRIEEVESVLDRLFADFWTLVARNRRVELVPLRTDPFAAVPTPTEEDPSKVGVVGNAAPSFGIFPSFSGDSGRTAASAVVKGEDEGMLTGNSGISGGNSEAEETRSRAEQSLARKKLARVAAQNANIKSLMALCENVSKSDDGGDTDSDDDDDNGRGVASGTKSRTFLCEYCNRDFNSARALKIHKTLLQCASRPASVPNKSSRVSCDVCGVSLKDAWALAKHKRVVHSIGLIVGPNGDPIRKYACELCESSFDVRDELVDHERTAHASALESFPCTKCDKKFMTLRKLKRHVHVHNKSTVICPICGTGLYGKDPTTRLKNHIAVKHEKTKRLKCSECAEMFILSGSLRRHQWKVHGMWREKFEHQCPICGKVVASNRELVKHQFNKHDVPCENLKTWTCELCGKKFSAKPAHASHVKTHLRIKPHACPESGCVFSAVLLTTLEKHLKSVHNRVVRQALQKVRSDGASYTSVNHAKKSTSEGLRHHEIQRISINPSADVDGDCRLQVSSLSTSKQY